MAWKKLGKIFDPVEHTLPNNCFEYAQSPQTLVFKDFVRIFFSTREKEISTGKFLSHICYVDFRKNLADIICVSKKTVIDLGELGCYDEHGIFPLNVLRKGSHVYGYICGWSRKKSVSVDTSIGLAISNDDGKSFKRIGNGPILTSSLKEPFLVGDPFVLNCGEKYYMWYIFGTGWKKFEPNSPPDRTYKIGYAVSSDAINWQKPEEGRQIISDKLGPDESQALPTVIKIGEIYHMFFCYRESFDFRKNTARGYRIGSAISEDLVNWKRDDSISGIDVSESGWDSDMLCYPHVFECNEKQYLLYNGNEFGRRGFGLAVWE